VIGGIIISWHLLFPLLAALSSVVALFVLYWIIRLAVRHGIEDARRHRKRQAAEEAGWDPARR
jgi:uncharacterized membrane protein